MKDSRSKYQELVAKRKTCKLCRDFGFTNQSLTRFDTDEIGNWTTWANNLDADIMIVGQDYANQEIFNRDKGRIELNELHEQSSPQEYSTVTNYNLRELTKLIGYDIGLPTQTSKERIFITNSVLCLKLGAMNASIPQSVYKNCGSEFLTLLIEIVSPKAIITLGSTATKATILTFADQIENSGALMKTSFAKVFSKSPISVKKSKTLIFPVYHPGPLGIMNRSKIEADKMSGLDLQKNDWLKIKESVTAYNKCEKIKAANSAAF